MLAMLASGPDRLRAGEEPRIVILYADNSARRHMAADPRLEVYSAGTALAPRINHIKLTL
jgi:hypothetical protein